MGSLRAYAYVPKTVRIVVFRAIYARARRTRVVFNMARLLQGFHHRQPVKLPAFLAMLPRSRIAETMQPVRVIHEACSVGRASIP